MSPADISRRVCQTEMSHPEIESKASEKKMGSPSPPSTAEKGVKWSPNLVEFSDGSKIQSAIARSAEEKKDQTLSEERRRQKSDARGKSSGHPKEPIKPPMVHCMCM